MIVTTSDQLDEVVEAYMGFDEFVFDVESKGEHRGDPRRNDVFWMGLAGPGRADVIPMGHPLGRMVLPARTEREKNPATGRMRQVRKPPMYGPVPEQLDKATVFSALKRLFFSDRRKIGQFVRFDLKSTAKYFGEVPPPPYGDVSVAAHLINENRPRLGLEFLVPSDLKFKYAKIGKNVETHPFDAAALYNYFDAKFEWLLWRKYIPMLERMNLMGVFDMEMDVLEALIPMELEGAPIDVDAMEVLDEELSTRLGEIQAKIDKAAGYHVDLNKPLEKGRFVYDVRKHKPREFTKVKKEPATTAAALGRYAHDPAVAAMLDYAEVAKLHSTYVAGLLNHLSEDGRLRADFVQQGTVTGRFSCRNPNLQNIPARDKAGGVAIRNLFVAPPGYKLIVADYSQIELRMLAWYCRDPLMVKNFQAGIDAHITTAMGAFRIARPEDVKPEQRAIAKNLNFAVVYGAGPEKVAAMSGISLTQAKQMLELHQEQFPIIYSWKNKVLRTCRSRRPPYVKTIMGRKRRVPQVCAQDYKLRGRAERQAINTIIQGSSADLIKLAMIRLHRLNCASAIDLRPILTVHDELVSLVHEDVADEGAEMVQEAMEGDLCKLIAPIPLKAEIKVCDRWSEGK